MFGIPRWLLNKLEKSGEITPEFTPSHQKRYPLLAILRTASFLCRDVAIYTSPLNTDERANILKRLAINHGLNPVFSVTETSTDMDKSLATRSGFIEVLKLKERGKITGVVATMISVKQVTPISLIWLRALQMCHFWLLVYDPLWGDKLTCYPEPYPDCIRLI
jgi:hypothetical protein